MASDKAKLQGKIAAAITEAKCESLVPVLLRNGVCPRCTLRVLGVFVGEVYTLPPCAIADALAPFLSSAHDGHPTTTTATITTTTDGETATTACIACLGVLQRNEFGVVREVQAHGYEGKQIRIRVFLPHTVRVRELELEAWARSTCPNLPDMATCKETIRYLALVEVHSTGDYQVDQNADLWVTLGFDYRADEAVLRRCADVCGYELQRKRKLSYREHQQHKAVQEQHRIRDVSGGVSLFSLQQVEEIAKSLVKRRKANGTARSSNNDSKNNTSDRTNADSENPKDGRDDLDPHGKHQDLGSVFGSPVLDPTTTTMGVTVQRRAIMIAGRYVKLVRGLSQTPWAVDGSRSGSSSVEEELVNPIKMFFVDSNPNPIPNPTAAEPTATTTPLAPEPTAAAAAAAARSCGDRHTAAHTLDGRAQEDVEFKFLSSGREDIDVRMLGNGRPFILEVVNCRKERLDQQLLDKVQAAINNSSDLVQVNGLHACSVEESNQLKDSIDSKRKQYACVVWVSKPVTKSMLAAKLDCIHDMPIDQRTPVRVLHRRSLLVRPKVLHSVQSEFINEHYFILRLVTSAGLYVKEFVHGDLGRTEPCVATLLDCEADILQLDVLDVFT